MESTSRLQGTKKRLYKEKNKQTSAVVQKTLINSKYILGQF